MKHLRRSSLLVLAAALMAAPTLFAQAAPTGRIVGRVIDVATSLPITGAAVQLVGTTQGTMTGVDGRYTVTNVTPGTVSILVRRIGYAPKTVTAWSSRPASHSNRMSRWQRRASRCRP